MAEEVVADKRIRRWNTNGDEENFASKPAGLIGQPMVAFPPQPGSGI